MKQKLLFILCLAATVYAEAQEYNRNYYEFESNYFYGTILQHAPSIQHLITSHPQAIMLSASKKTFGKEAWSNRYGAPDYGYTFLYQDFGTEILGDAYALYGHYNFYFLKRQLMLKIGAGLAYHTNPYDPDTNFRNNAHGTHFTSSEFVMLNYKKENIYKGLGLQAGFSIVHYSNGNVKPPNTSTNTWFFGVGLNYNPDFENLPAYIPKAGLEKYSEPIKFNIAFRTGVNSSDVIGLGQFIHYTFSAFADKKINRKSTFQAGVDVFVSPMLKSFIEYRATAFPELNEDPDADSNRVGVFLGHLLTINKTGILVHLGYYAYYPYDFEGRIYNRLGIQRTFGKHFFGGINVKAHAANAESFEFTLGYRL